MRSHWNAARLSASSCTATDPPRHQRAARESMTSTVSHSQRAPAPDAGLRQPAVEEAVIASPGELGCAGSSIVWHGEERSPNSTSSVAWRWTGTATSSWLIRFAAADLGFYRDGQSGSLCGGAGAPGTASPSSSPRERWSRASWSPPTCPSRARAAVAWTVARSGPPRWPRGRSFSRPDGHGLGRRGLRLLERGACSAQQDCVGAWLASTGQTQGYIMDLATLWHLASAAPISAKTRQAPPPTSAP